MAENQRDSIRQGVVGVIMRQNRFLVIQRSSTVMAPGAFCFPGGGIESGETEEMALVRELQEELAVPSQPLRRIWRSTTKRKIELAWWLADIGHAPPTANPEEVADVYWWTAQEMLQRGAQLLESNWDFLQELRAGKICVE